MMNHPNFNIDHAVECVKTLADNSRCKSCDKLTGPRIRYPCGHCICQSCVLNSEECLRCLSPPNDSINFTDEPYSRRIEHAYDLLIKFQDVFKLDVYKRQRLSKQLKLEKQLFPKCIQAPLKYSNKRRTSDTHDKENLSDFILPGESVQSTDIMDKTTNYVQQWLSKNESSFKKSANLPRQPLTDLKAYGDVNSKNVMSYNRDNIFSHSLRKRTHIKVFDNSTNKDNLKNTVRKKKKKQKHTKSKLNLTVKDILIDQNLNSENDESGIVIDDTTIIEDSQSNVVTDKDKLALLAVREAEKLCHINSSNMIQTKNYNLFESNHTATNKFEISKCSFYKIPFYKKGSLCKTLPECVINEIVNNKIKNNVNDVVVTIDNKSFTTTIKFSQCSDKIKICNRKSVEVQTDNFHEKEINQVINTNAKSIINEDLIEENDDSNENRYKSEIQREAPMAKCVVVEDSDSDSYVMNSESGSKQCLVTADVHRSYNDYGVLYKLEPEEFKNRKRHANRGHTPLSTDSSDKENYDPNRKKRQKNTKKCLKKN